MADGVNHCIKVFTSQGHLSKTVWDCGRLAGVAFHRKDGVYLVVQDHSVAVRDQTRLSLNSYMCGESFVVDVYGAGLEGSGVGQFRSPSSIACDSTGQVYVADTGNHRIQVFSAEGEYLRNFYVVGPHGIAVDSDDKVYVSADGQNHISVYTSGGRFVRSFGRMGAGPGEFDSPRGVDENGVLYVCDYNNCRVQVF